MATHTDCMKAGRIELGYSITSSSQKMARTNMKKSVRTKMHMGIFQCHIQSRSPYVGGGGDRRRKRRLRFVSGIKPAVMMAAARVAP